MTLNAYEVRMERTVHVLEFSYVTVHARNEDEARDKALDIEAQGGKDDIGHYQNWDYNETVDTGSAIITDVEMIAEDIGDDDDEDEKGDGTLTPYAEDVIKYYRSGDENLPPDELQQRIIDRKRAAR